MDTFEFLRFLDQYAKDNGLKLSCLKIDPRVTGNGEICFVNFGFKVELEKKNDVIKIAEEIEKSLDQE